MRPRPSVPRPTDDFRLGRKSLTLRHEARRYLHLREPNQPGTAGDSDHNMSLRRDHRQSASAAAPSAAPPSHDYLNRHNAEPKPFVWIKAGDAILKKERRALDALEAVKIGYQALDAGH